MDQRAFQEELDNLERGLDRLRAKYELYFQGIERIEPQRDREAIERGMRRLLREVPNNTSLRFRFNTFKQKLITMKTYWARISRQIEEGTYRRHVQRAKKRFGYDRPQEEGAPKKQAYELDMEDDGNLDLDQLFAQITSPNEDKGPSNRVTRQRTPGGLPAVPQRPSRVPPKAPTLSRPDKEPNLAQSAKKMGASLPPSLPRSNASQEERYRKVYDRYLEERKKNNQRVDHLRYESVAKKLEKMVPQLEAKHKGKKIDFEVVVQGGKVGIKPIAKK